MKRWMLPVLNVLIIVIGVCFAFRYTNRLQTERTLAARESFAATVESMETVTMGYLTSQQGYVMDWAAYIDANGYTMDEALEFLRGINTDDAVSAHIIDTTTYQGKGTDGNAAYGSLTEGQDSDVDYSRQKAEIQEQIAGIAASEEAGSELQIVGSYTNPSNGQQSVGFAARITLKEADGTSGDYLLLRVLPVTALQEQWTFPTGYEDAQIGLIAADGTYIVRSSAMKSENFYEFLRAYNDLTYPQQDELKQSVSEKESGILNYKNARGKDSYWVYDFVGDTKNWMVVGYVPVESLGTVDQDWTVVAIVTGMMGLLFLVDALYFRRMGNRLRESMRAANSANEAKTRFLSSMSHDIRTPMNAVVGMTTVAMRNLGDTERVGDCLKKIALASNHLLTLINDILDISKVESGKFALNPMVFSLPETLTNLANIVRPQVRAKELDFRMHVTHLAHEYLYADELRLNQIFINLLSNAVKYTPVGGSVVVTLTQELSETDPKNVRLVYTVADTGIGMEPEFIETMFQPFSRAKDSRIDVIEGSGLGLAITKRMVDAMHGTIEVESEVGKGSTFTVTVEMPAAEKMTDDLMLPPMRMLVADDDELFLESAKDTFASLGVQADTVGSGREAVEAAVAQEKKGAGYPIIILDWQMPGMDGLETARQIRGQIGADVPIIILSSYDWTEIEEEAKAVGVNGFISKPLFRAAAYETINGLLHLKEEPKRSEEEEDEQFRGMHLLVAEDNNMNWEIIEELLSYHGITADRAENGKICVEKMEEAQEGAYDAVLMDVQMPVMNGREASVRLRKSEIPWVRQIPIFAMTADAFAEDIRACLDAGMNGHIAKPIDMKQLLKHLKSVKR